MRWRVAVMLTAMFSALTGPAIAAELDDVAEALRTEGFYVEAGAGSTDGLRDQVDATDGQIGLASFADDLGDATVVAEDLSTRSGLSTVIVLTTIEIGVFSTRFSDIQLSDAIDASLDAFDRSLAEGYEVFVGTLPGSAVPGPTDEQPTTPQPTTAVPVPTPEPASSGGFPLGTVILLVLVGGGAFLWWRSREQAKQTAQRRVEEAQREVNEQVAEISNEILDLSDRVMVSDDQPARDSFQEATAVFSRAQDSLERATTVATLEDVSDHLDDTRYLLDVTEAHLDGRPIPEKPPAERMRCFFDPRHPRATETATLKTAAGQRTVAVCEADAAKLRRGQRPDVRGIDVDGRRVPAPRAPRSYGGSGLDWLDVFSVIVGGSNALDFDLGGRQRVPQRRTVYPPLPRRSSGASRTVVPGPRSARSAGRSSGSAGRRSGGRASRSRGSHRAAGKARRRR